MIWGFFHLHVSVKFCPLPVRSWNSSNESKMAPWSTKQRSFPEHRRASQELCVVTQRAWWQNSQNRLITTFLVLSAQCLLYIAFDGGKIFKFLFSSLLLLKFLSFSFAISFQLSTTMYNFCVVLAMWGISGKKKKKDKYVWCGIAWLRESWFADVRDRSRPLRFSPSG